jgi:hypothetical protein
VATAAHPDPGERLRRPEYDRFFLGLQQPPQRVDGGRERRGDEPGGHVVALPRARESQRGEQIERDFGGVRACGLAAGDGGHDNTRSDNEIGDW